MSLEYKAVESGRLFGNPGKRLERDLNEQARAGWESYFIMPVHFLGTTIGYRTAFLRQTETRESASLKG
jgi:hypothetical protein